MRGSTGRVLQPRRSPILPGGAPCVVRGSPSRPRTHCVVTRAGTRLAPLPASPARPLARLRGREGPARASTIVLVSGDEEYRSEEALPQLAKILAKHHGFKCTVLFAIAQGRHDRPEPERQHPRPRVAPDGRPDDHRHALPQPARRADEARRRLRRVGPADHRHAHGDARLQHQGQDLREVHLEQQGMGRRLRPAGAGRDLGQPPRATTARRARAASSRRARRTTRSCAASRTATSGARPTSTKPIPPADCTPLVLGQVLDGHEADRQAASKARRTTR